MTILTSETTHLSSSQLFSIPPQPVLKVLGLGGGGCNAVERMIELNLNGVQFIAANTDRQTLETNPAPTRILLGPQTTHGFGSGGNPMVGRAAAIESRSQIAAALAGADMVFLTAGMGGGTGTGAIPVAAEISRTLGAVTIAIVTTPFQFEAGRREKNANEGIARLREHTHTLITIPNDRLLSVAPRNLSMQSAFFLADDVLRQAVQAISELITETGMINVDFAHIKRLMQLGGGALMAIGQGEGQGKVQQALQQALHHPLLDNIPLHHAAGVIANFTGGSDLTLLEIQAGLTELQSQTGAQTEIVPGVITDERLTNRVQLILMVTGLGATALDDSFLPIQLPKVQPEPEQPELDPIEDAVVQENRVSSFEMQPAYLASSSQNSDLPAFLRFRTALSSQFGAARREK